MPQWQRMHVVVVKLDLDWRRPGSNVCYETVKLVRGCVDIVSRHCRRL